MASGRWDSIVQATGAAIGSAFSKMQVRNPLEMALEPPPPPRTPETIAAERRIVNDVERRARDRRERRLRDKVKISKRRKR